MKNAFKIIGLILVVAATVLATFTDVAIVDYTAIAVAFIGAAMSIVATWKKSENKDWKVIITIICIALGAFLCGFAGFAEATITQVISAVAGVVILIVGLITSFIPKKE